MPPSVGAWAFERPVEGSSDSSHPPWPPRPAQAWPAAMRHVAARCQPRRFMHATFKGTVCQPRSAIILTNCADRFFVVLVGHQRRVGRVHDDAIGNAQGDDQMIVRSAHDRAAGAQAQVLGRDRVALARRCLAAGRSPANCRRRPRRTAPRSPPRRGRAPSRHSRSTRPGWR